MEANEKMYLSLMENWYSSYGLAGAQFLIDTEAYRILGLEPEQDFNQKKVQERFDWVKINFGAGSEKFEFAKKLINQSASILKVPSEKSKYSSNIKKIKLDRLWDGIAVMCENKNLKKNDKIKAVSRAKVLGLTEKDLEELLKSKAVNVLNTNEEVIVKKVGGTPKIDMSCNKNFEENGVLFLEDVNIQRTISETFIVRNGGGGEFEAEVSSPFSWISFNRTNINHADLPFKLEVKVSLFKDKSIALGSSQNGYFEVILPNDSKKINLTVLVEGKAFLEARNTKKAIIIGSYSTIILSFFFGFISLIKDYSTTKSLNGFTAIVLILASMFCLYQIRNYKKTDWYNYKVLVVAIFMYIFVYTGNLIFMPIVYLTKYIAKSFFRSNAEKTKFSYIIPLAVSLLTIILQLNLKPSGNLFNISDPFGYSNSENKQSAYQYTGNVSAKNGLVLRSEPSKKGSAILTLSYQEKVAVINAENPEWLYVRVETSNGTIVGYVSSKFININQ